MQGFTTIDLVILIIYLIDVLLVGMCTSQQKLDTKYSFSVITA